MNKRYGQNQNDERTSCQRMDNDPLGKNEPKFIHYTYTSSKTLPKYVTTEEGVFAHGNGRNRYKLSNKQGKTNDKPLSVQMFNALVHASAPVNMLLHSNTHFSRNYDNCETLPSKDGYKKIILNSVIENQVTIISADVYYSASEVIPGFLHRLYPNHMILCSEPNAASAAAVAQRCSMFLFNRVQPDLVSFVTEEESTKTSNTIILFISVKKLFYEILQDSDLSNYNCIIFHCDVRRSVQADFVLEHLRGCVSRRRNLKLVLLLSILDDVPKFQMYFSVCASVKNVVASNETFPVQKVWKKAAYCADNNYIHEVVVTALAIQACHKLGDVLVFLPTPADISKVLNLLSSEFNKYGYCDVKCIPLYDDVIEQQYLHYPMPNIQGSIRNFFLTTSWAEMVVLPSVKYVIDTGIRRDLHYDAVTAADSVTQTFISQVKARLRKNCVGNFAPGVCYRLYNKDDYLKRMSPTESPEIMLKNPVDIMLKTFSLVTKGVAFTDFIEALDEEQREKALTTLKSANIVKDNKLTNLGLLVDKLPYCYKYSKLIVIGAQWGYAFESIVLVAFFLSKATIFNYDKDNTKLQKRVDATKLQYACRDSDTLTNLKIYLDWVSYGSDKSWCASRALNFNMLRKVQSFVEAIVPVVTKKLKQDLSDTKVDRDWSVIQEMLFECSKENLCIYTGHFRSGYCLLSTDTITFLHPSSSILQKSSLPKFVTFDHLKPTSRQFMMGVTAIPESLFHSTTEMETLETESDFLGKVLDSVVIENVGIMLIKQGLLGKKGKKLFVVENSIKKEIKCGLLIIEPSVEKGTVTLYAPKNYIHKAETIMRNMLEVKLKDVLNEEETMTFELVKKPFKVPIGVTWTKGAVVTHAKVKSETKNRIPKSEEFGNKEPIVKSSIHLTWTRRRCRGIGYAAFDNPRSFSVARRLCTKTVEVIGHIASIALDIKHANQLFISGLSEETTNEDLEHALNRALSQKLVSDIKVKTAFVAYSVAFETTEYQCEVIRQKLLFIFSKILGDVDIDVVIPKPDDSAIIMKAFVNLKSSIVEGKSVQLLNKLLTVDGLSVKAQPVYYSIIICQSNVFNVLKDVIDLDLQQLKAKLKPGLSNFSADDLFKYNGEVHKHCSFARLKLSSNNIDILNTLQRRIHSLLEGEVITQEMVHNFHKIFTHGGHLRLKALERETEICIVEEYKMKTLRLYGPKTRCSMAFREIRHFLYETRNEIVKCVDLSAGKHLRAVLKSVIRQYGLDLKLLIEICQLRSAEIDIRASKITLYGKPSSIEKATQKLEGMAKFYSATIDEDLQPMQEPCCICDMPPLQSSVRLEHCGHLCCAECIKGLIVTTELPIQCCAQDCGKDLILEDIRKGLDYDDEEIKCLLNRSLTNFILRNNQHLIYCPAPDCSFFFDDRKISKSKWTCDLCQNEICVVCKVVFHHGYTCDTYQKLKKDPDYSVKVWLNENKGLRKTCPTCKAAIEKNGGCNHMTCHFCKAHFCWLCQTAFPDQQLVYDHQPVCPKRYE